MEIKGQIEGRDKKEVEGRDQGRVFSDIDSGRWLLEGELRLSSVSIPLHSY